MNYFLAYCYYSKGIQYFLATEKFRIFNNKNQMKMAVNNFRHLPPFLLSKV